VLSPKSSPRGKLLSQYVRARITRIDDSNMALFDRDWNNTLYYFVMDADERIYLRYGGRDARGSDVYLNLDSIELAMAKGLELHRRAQAGELKLPDPPKPLYPREIPMLFENTFQKGRCVECHLAGDYLLQQREREGTLDRMTQLFRWPDIRLIGIDLDVPKGLVVKNATGPVAAAGMLAGDRIDGIEGTPVHTFADLQYHYDKLPRAARQARFTVDRGGRAVELTVALPALWWVSDIRFRQMSVDPRAEFESRPLAADEKRRHGLNPEGFAGEVTSIGGFATMLKVHELRLGDIVYAVDRVETDEIANTPDLFIKLRKTAGDTVTVGVLRDGKRFDMSVRTQRMFFRK
jgi:hypothetical protein